MSAPTYEQHVAVNGVRLWVCQQGSGPPLVLCPGGAGFCDYLEPVANLVDDLVRVDRFDPRGCGRSGWLPPYDVRTQLADLEGLRTSLGHRRWLVGGHSFGADLALAYALEHPDRTLALLYLSGTGVQDDRQWKAAYEAGKEAGLDDAPEVAYPVNLAVNRAANDSWRQYIKDPLLLRRLSRLTVPTLAVCGSRDIRPRWPVEQLVHLLPDATLHVIDGAGHCPWLTHQRELRRVMRAFLIGVSGTTTFAGSRRSVRQHAAAASQRSTFPAGIESLHRRGYVFNRPVRVIAVDRLDRDAPRWRPAAPAKGASCATRRALAVVSASSCRPRRTA